MGQAFLVDAAIGNLSLIVHFAIVRLDRLLEIVDVDELNVELIVEMFYVLELIFGECLTGDLSELGFVLLEFFPELAKFLSPGFALPGEL